MRMNCTTGRHDLSRGMDAIYSLPGHLIRRLHQISVSAFISETSAAGFDLTPVQFAVIRMLHAHPGIDQGTLAGLAAVDRVTMGGVIARLEKRGYLERHVGEKDRRSRTLKLTERGETLLQTIWPAVRHTQDVILAGLTEDEKDTLIALLKKATEAGNKISRAPLRQAPCPADEADRTD